jgi:hypothetical protein
MACIEFLPECLPHEVGLGAGPWTEVLMGYNALKIST